MAQELSVLLNFAYDGESDLATLGRVQVLGATCCVMATFPNLARPRIVMTSPGYPFRPYFGVRIGPNLEGKNSQKCNSNFRRVFTWTEVDFLASNLMIISENVEFGLKFQNHPSAPT